MTEPSLARASRPSADYPLHTGFDLSGADGTYASVIPKRWTFGADLVFGGYSSALTLAASGLAIGLSHLLSCHVVFVKPVRPGRITIAVETIVRGRRSGAVRAVASQDEAVVLTVSAWLADRLEPSHSPPADAFGKDPDCCPPITFRAQRAPFMAAFDERAIDYPESIEAFVGQSPVVDLWTRPRANSLGQMNSQLFDVMAFDAHMLDPVLRSRTDTDADSVSLDLAVQWRSTGPLDAWRRVKCESDRGAEGFAATHGFLADRNDSVRARATQVGLVRQREGSAVWATKKGSGS